MVEDSNKPVLLAFKATGILESRSYRLEIRPPASIIVGPNGTGKSTFLSLFYLFVSRQWQRLNEFDFDTLTLIHSRGSVSLNKTDLLSFEVTPTQPGGLGHAIARFQERGAMDLLYKSSLTKEEREQFSAISRFPVDQITSFRRYLQKELGFTKRAYEVDAEVAALGFGEILYLPTYRRIEKDIRSIFPDIENRIRNKIADGYMTPRTGAGFKEIAGFGMADIQQIVDRYTSDIRDYRRQVSETASQEYIRDIITGKIRKYSLSNLRKMQDDDFEDFKNSLDDKLFSAADRASFHRRIDELRARQTGQPTAESRFLGMFVEKLLVAHQDVKERERPLRSFISLVTKYLRPRKLVTFDGHNIVIKSTVDSNDTVQLDKLPTVQLDKLSSGEKQVVSIFAYLFLSGQKNFLLMIDEPELSLSVPWQKRFLPDLIDTGSCAHIISVTHSPFVFDNDLKSSVVDVRRLRVAGDE